MAAFPEYPPPPVPGHRRFTFAGPVDNPDSAYISCRVGRVRVRARLPGRLRAQGRCARRRRAGARVGALGEGGLCRGGFVRRGAARVRWLDGDGPAELARAGHSRPPLGIRVVCADFAAHERCEIDGFRVTPPARTGFDIARRLPRDRAVPILDALCAATGLAAEEITAIASEHPRARGTKRLGAVIPVIDGGAESPPESHTRLLLLDNGLPPPTTQLVLRDEYGCFVARLDMGWEAWRVAVELGPMITPQAWSRRGNTSTSRVAGIGCRAACLGQSRTSPRRSPGAARRSLRGVPTSPWSGETM